MNSYGELQPGAYYLIQADAESDIELVSVLMQTKETVLLRSWLPATEDFFCYGGETIYKLIEELGPEMVVKFEGLYGEAGQEEFFTYDEDEED